MMNDFWTFTISGVIVAWPPLVIGFVAHHVKIKKFITQTTDDQDAKIAQITKDQTLVIRKITSDQTRQLEGKQPFPPSP